MHRQTGANVQSRMFRAEHCREASANVQRWKTLGTILLHFDSQLSRRATSPAKWQRFKIDSISVMKMGCFFLVHFDNEDEIDGGDNAHFKIGPQIKCAQNQNFIGFREFNFARFFPFSILQECC